MRWMPLAVLTTLTATTACTRSADQPAEAVHKTVSGLRPGGEGFQPAPGAPGLSSTGFAPARPGAGPNAPLDIVPGNYTEVILGVLDAHPERTDLVVDAERTVLVETAGAGWMLDGFISLEAIEGRFSGGGDRLEVDPENDCWMEVAVQVEGVDGRPDRFRLFVEELVIVSGKECDRSDLGPLRWEENTYRVQMIAQD